MATKQASKNRIDYLVSIIKEEIIRIKELEQSRGKDRNGWVDECAQRYLSGYKQEVNKLAGLKVYLDVI